jgi:predicted AAA+ superfamily ATPase
MSQMDRFLQPSENSFFLFGPRGTGKTVWVKKKFTGGLFIDLLSPENFRKYLAMPERLRELVDGRLAVSRQPFSLVIDEVQRIPQLLDVVHALTVEHPQIRFILTGSSVRKIRRQNTNLLGGRASLRVMHPFMAAEMGTRFDLNDATRVGMLPVVFGSNDPQDAIGAYVGTYLEEEVKHESVLRNAGSFVRFLEVASFSHGTIANMASIGRECGISAPTVKAYFEILEDMLLSFTVPIFAKRAKCTLVSKAKFYFCDSGIYVALRPRGMLDRASEIGGLALEGLVAQHLRAWCDYSGHGAELFHWRTKSGVEVDFVVYGENTLAAIEVKHSADVRSEHLSGLRAFGTDYPEAQLYLLHRGSEIRKIGNVLCLPCDEFLRNLVPGKRLFP